MNLRSFHRSTESTAERRARISREREIVGRRETPHRYSIMIIPPAPAGVQKRPAYSLRNGIVQRYALRSQSKLKGKQVERAGVAAPLFGETKPPEKSEKVETASGEFLRKGSRGKKACNICCEDKP